MNTFDHDGEGRYFFGSNHLISDGETYESHKSGTFTCRQCGKATYRNGEFETIKLGDIFTAISQFASDPEGSGNLCTECVDSIGPGRPMKTNMVNNTTPTIIQNVNCYSQQSQPLKQEQMSHHEHESLGLSNTSHNPQVPNNDALTGNENLLMNSAKSSPSHSILQYASSSAPNALTSTVNNNSIIVGMYRENNALESPPVMRVTPGAMSNPQQHPSVLPSTLPLSHIQNPNHHPVHVTVLSTNSGENQVDIEYTIPYDPNIDIKYAPVPVSSLGIHTTNTTSVTNNSSGYQLPQRSGQDINNKPGSNTSSVPKKPKKSKKKANTVPVAEEPTPVLSLKSGLPRPIGKECQVCKKTFKNNKTASAHFQKVHEKESRFVCEICGAVFSYRGSLDSHLASHETPTVSFDCKTCGKKFKEKANLNSHMQIHSDVRKNFPCDYCPSGFTKRVNLRYHIKRKHPDKVDAMNNNTIGSDAILGLPVNMPPPASVSHLSFVANNGDREEKPAPNSKPEGNFKCDQCNRTFLFKNNLKAHLRTHTRDKKYTCEICQKSFIYKESLKNHMLLHSNEMPYLCDICGKKFRDRSNRRKHVKNVHKYIFGNGELSTLSGASGLNGDSARLAGMNAGSSGTELNPKPKKKKTKKQAINDNSSYLDSQREIIKGPKAKKKKDKGAAASNKKSVIVSTTSSSEALDRRIIVSPSPKPPDNAEFVQVHVSNLPVTVHVPVTASNLSPDQYSQSHGRNVIVKASSTIHTNHSPAVSPDLNMYQQQQHQPSSMQQNVIVYSKSKVLSDQQNYPASTVISQIPHQDQQYYSPSQGPAVSQYEENAYRTNISLGQQSQGSSLQQQLPQMDNVYDYNASNQSTADRTAELAHYSTNPPTSSEIPQYSNIYSSDPIVFHPHSHDQQQQQHYWTTPIPGPTSPNTSAVTSHYNVNPSSQNDPATSVAPVSFDSSITAASNVLNTPAYTVQGHDGMVADPSGNGSGYFYKDLSQFDFSYL